MLNLVFGLHLYQPPTQFPQVVEQIAEESYRPVFRILRDHPRAYICLDIAASALELLETYAPDVIRLMQECFSLRKMHLVNTAAYHPILPLIPESEIEHQLALNLGTLERMFGALTTPRGCFLPEMAFSADVLPALRRQLAGWTVTDDVPYRALYKKDSPFNWVPKESKTAIFLRSNLWSNRLSRFDNRENYPYTNGAVFARELQKGMREWQGADTDGYIVVWLDFETYGHHSRQHRPYLYETFFPALFDSQNDAFRLTDPDEFLRRYPKRQTIIPAGSWSTSEEQWREGNYFPLWADEHNPFHLHWWNLVYLALGIVQRTADSFIRRLGDKMVYSCQPWQYSCGNKALAKAGLHYFEEVIQAGTPSERSEGGSALSVLRDLTRE